MIQRRKYMKTIWLGLSILSIALLISCSTAKKDTSIEDKKPVGMQSNANVSQPDPKTSQCDPTLWQHVWDPSRLQVLEDCKVVTGVIDELDENEDGDTHMLLKLDPGQENLLLKKNLKKKDGDLVIEVVCAHPVSDKKAVAACAGFSSTVPLPKVGDSVRVTGSYVIDSHNGWSEIHPVSKIETRDQK
jgi:hypothetical protein